MVSTPQLSLIILLFPRGKANEERSDESQPPVSGGERPDWYRKIILITDTILILIYFKRGIK